MIKSVFPFIRIYIHCVMHLIEVSMLVSDIEWNSICMLISLEYGLLFFNFMITYDPWTKQLIIENIQLSFFFNVETKK